MPHLILLGDSIFDNGRYVNGAPDVGQQLQHLCPDSVHITSLAIDGAITESIFLQIRALPDDATHLVLSVGGNDALSSKAMLDYPVDTVADALRMLATQLDVFESHYRSLIQHLSTYPLPLLICTIYNANFAEPAIQQSVKTAIALYNDVIIRVANEFKYPVLDLRTICTVASDYANPIEPSARGGHKIASAIARHFNLIHAVDNALIPLPRVNAAAIPDLIHMVVISDTDDQVGMLELDHDVDFLICLGDLYDATIQKAIDVYAPEYVLGIRGNHDVDQAFPAPCIHLHNDTIELKGIRFGGFSGSWKYKSQGFHLYEQTEVESVDIFIAHNSPFGYHERDTDTHQVFKGFVDYIDRVQPRYFLHGHQHKNKTSLRNTTLIQGVYGERLIILNR